MNRHNVEEASRQQGVASRRNYWLALLCTAIAIIAPVWIVDFPGMVDYPNHLARCYVLAHFHDNPVWQQRYLIDSTPLPNLAMDLIVVPLNHVLPILLSGKIFLTLTALLYLLGCTWLGYAATGRRSWIALIVAFTLYNSTFLYGFVNYMFSVAVFLCAFAFWMQSRNRMTWIRFALCGASSIATFLSHLSGIVFLGVACCTVALLELRVHRSVLRLIRQLAWLVCPLLVMAAFMKKSGQVGVVEWSTLHDKAIHLFIPIRSYSLSLDIAVLAVLIVCVLVLARGARIDPLAIVAAVFFFLFVISPDGLFQSSAVDARYILPAFALAFLSIEPKVMRPQRIAIAVALLAMFLHTCEIAANWIKIDRRQHQVLAMGDLLPPDASVFVLPHSAAETADKLDRGFYNLTAFWTVSHQANVSILFSKPGMQPLVARQSQPCSDVHWVVCAAVADYLWSDHPLPENEPLLRSLADPVSTLGTITLWKVRHSAKD